MFVYVLSLENGKYYIGKTKSPPRRLAEHRSGNGTAWTKLHRPVKFVKIIPNCDGFDEDKLVKQYMSIYGIDSVRGGSYSSPELPKEVHRFLKNEIRGGTDKCFKCGATGHYASACIIDMQDDSANLVVCDKCGARGHYAIECTIAPTATPYEVSCDKCGDVYRPTRENKEYHLNCHQGWRGTPLEVAMRYNTCDILLKIVDEIRVAKPSYIPNVPTMTGAFECPLCNKMFQKQKWLFRHVVTNCPNSSKTLRSVEGWASAISQNPPCRRSWSDKPVAASSSDARVGDLPGIRDHTFVSRASDGALECSPFRRGS